MCTQMKLFKWSTYEIRMICMYIRQQKLVTSTSTPNKFDRFISFDLIWNMGMEKRQYNNNIINWKNQQKSQHTRSIIWSTTNESMISNIILRLILNCNKICLKAKGRRHMGRIRPKDILWRVSISVYMALPLIYINIGHLIMHHTAFIWKTWNTQHMQLIGALFENPVLISFSLLFFCLFYKYAISF